MPNDDLEKLLKEVPPGEWARQRASLSVAMLERTAGEALL